MEGISVPSWTFQSFGFLLSSIDRPIQYAHSVFDDGMAKLTVQDALPEDDGLYTCLAENNAGRASCSAQVTVKGEYFEGWHPNYIYDKQDMDYI